MVAVDTFLTALYVMVDDLYKTSPANEALQTVTVSTDRGSNKRDCGV
jgi:hypothetical protein